MVYHLLILQYSANLSGPYCALDSLVSVSKTHSMCLIVRDIISLEIYMLDIFTAILTLMMQAV